MLKGHKGDVACAAFSPDGKRIVTGAYDRTARLWDASDGHEIATLRAHAAPVTWVGFSPTGDAILTSSGGTAHLWTARTEDLMALADSRITRTLHRRRGGAVQGPARREDARGTGGEAEGRRPLRGLRHDRRGREAAPGGPEAHAGGAGGRPRTRPRPRRRAGSAPRGVARARRGQGRAHGRRRGARRLPEGRRAGRPRGQRRALPDPRGQRGRAREDGLRGRCPQGVQGGAPPPSRSGSWPRFGRPCPPDGSLRVGRGRGRARPRGDRRRQGRALHGVVRPPAFPLRPAQGRAPRARARRRKRRRGLGGGARGHAPRRPPAAPAREGRRRPRAGEVALERTSRTRAPARSSSSATARKWS